MSVVSTWIAANTFWVRFAAYAAAAALLFGSGWKVEQWRADSQIANLKAADAQERADGEKAVRQNLQTQLDTLKATQANNGNVIQRLQSENAQITADRDSNLALARRLLAGSPGPAPQGCSVPEAGDRSATSQASGAGRDESAAQLLVDVREECSRNANRLDALIDQLTPQL